MAGYNQAADRSQPLSDWINNSSLVTLLQKGTIHCLPNHHTFCEAGFEPARLREAAAIRPPCLPISTTHMAGPPSTD